MPMNDDAKNVPEPCESCGSFHTAEEHAAFEKAQRALREQMGEVVQKHTGAFERICEVLSEIDDNFEKTVLAAFVANWLFDVLQVPEEVFNRCLDAMVEASEASGLNDPRILAALAARKGEA